MFMSTIETSIDESVRTITFDRPNSYNAFDSTLRAEALATLKDAEDDDDVRCVVLTGNGKAFSAGGDIDTMQERFEDDETAAGFADHVDETANALMRALYHLSVPTIAKVDGVAVGMGLSVALACDIVIASDRSRFGAGFSGVGLGPDTGLSYMLPRRVGTQTALELLYTGELINAEMAADYGLVTRVESPNEIDDAVAELAKTVAQGPTKALVGAKDLVLRNLDRNFDDALHAEAVQQALLYTTDDHREGVRAFKAGEDPDFEGH
jgi:2-(1,2-epoxy-1,2-dihydrophenyl)acetyl-CoA isomerase